MLYAVMIGASVCPSHHTGNDRDDDDNDDVCPSHSWTVLKWLNISSDFFHHLVAPLSFFTVRFLIKFWQGYPWLGH